VLTQFETKLPYKLTLKLCFHLDKPFLLIYFRLSLLLKNKYHKHEASMNNPNSSNPLDSRIREHYENMPPSEKRLADLLLSFPGDVADYSASELCELAKTSKAAATRFFSRLGYKDFSDARRQAREAKNWGALNYQSSYKSDSKDGKVSDLVTKHLEREQTNLQRSLESIDVASFRSLLKALSSKKRVLVIGYRNNRFLAEYFHRQLAIIRDNVSLHPGANQTISEELFNIGPDDLLIIFGMRRRTPLLEKIIQHAKDKQTQIALISDPTAASIEKYASWKISCVIHSASTFDSYTSVMSILNLLITQLIEQSPDAAARINAIEAAHSQFAELGSL